ncbi:MAG: hypothetical protein EZS28_007263 [Streblomastix strix]|uniref:non-specific serine/threonine protein kinase n=1 Tax=Streblomastix strix TaxID=222440 RepID=A0A5J4WSX8_9EUKA|nr:MAG: hypothetical protein EZS28_007263 [Streblomastix strix]
MLLSLGSQRRCCHTETTASVDTFDCPLQPILADIEEHLHTSKVRIPNITAVPELRFYFSFSVTFSQLEMPVFTDYRIVRALGSGTLGSSFLIVEISTNKQCTWKEISVTNQSARKFAQDQIKQLQKINMKFIVPYLGSFFGKYDFFIIMEYCKMDNLRQFMNDLKQHGQSISEEQIWNLLSQIVEALHSLHEMDIIHQHLNPENIFLTGENHVKLCGFGLASVTLNLQEDYEKVEQLMITFAPEQLDKIYTPTKGSKGSEIDINNKQPIRTI